MTISYPFHTDTYKDIQRKIEIIAIEHHGDNTDAGCGFGVRDLGYYFPNVESAEATKLELDSLGIVGLETFTEEELSENVKNDRSC